MSEVTDVSGAVDRAAEALIGVPGRLDPATERLRNGEPGLCDGGVPGRDGTSCGDRGREGAVEGWVEVR